MAGVTELDLDFFIRYDNSDFDSNCNPHNPPCQGEGSTLHLPGIVETGKSFGLREQKGLTPIERTMNCFTTLRRDQRHGMGIHDVDI